MLERTVLKKTVIKRTMLQRAMLEKTVLQRTALEKTVPEGTVLEKSKLKKTVLGRTVLGGGGTMLDITLLAIFFTHWGSRDLSSSDYTLWFWSRSSLTLLAGADVCGWRD